MKSTELFDIAEQIIRISKFSTDVIIFYNEYLFQRFANSFIHQSTFEENLIISVRIKSENRYAIFYINNFDIEKIKLLLKTSENSMIESEFLFPLEKKEIPKYEFAFDNFEINPDESSRIIKDIIRIGGDYKAFGNFYRGFQHIAMLSSDGFEAYNKCSINHLTINYINSNSFWSQYSSYKFNDILENYEKIAKNCLNMAILNENPIEIKEGKYDVILSSLALSEIIDYLNYFALSSKNYYEGTSPFSGKLNEKIFSEKMNLYEEPYNLLLFPRGFDFEGNIKKEIPIIENGVLKNIALNNKYSKLLNLENNASSNVPFQDYPFFLHLHLKWGNKSLEDIIKETERGIFVNRIWYLNLVEPMSFTLTGMTRDGLFLIENGKIKSAIKNMRFTQSFIEVFNSVIEISRDEKLIINSNFYEFYPRGSLMPDIKVSNFNFISKTDF
ncbi:MAG: metallopeptidase TldD-related protein [candidate division WOR-3 bacterium]